MVPIWRDAFPTGSWIRSLCVSTPLEIVTSYKYLGVNFSSNCKFHSHFAETRVKVAAATTNVWTICKKSGVPPVETHLKLFNALVKSTLLYAAALWGWGLEEKIEKPQTTFIRRLFRLPPSSPAYFCRMEAGVAKVGLKTFKSTLDFWIRTANRPPH